MPSFLWLLLATSPDEGAYANSGLMEFNNPLIISYHLSLFNDPSQIKAIVIII